MNPSSIQYLLEQTVSLHESQPQTFGTTYTALMTSWVTWEALRTRFIRVVIHQKGWLLKDADKVLAKCHISSMAKAEKVLAQLNVTPPSQWPGQSGKVWRILREIEPLRHRLVHGFKTMEPVRIQAASEIVISAVTNHAWLSNVSLVDASKENAPVLVGSILDPLHSSPKKHHHRTLEELAQIMNIKLNGGQSSVPSMARLESLLKQISPEEDSHNS